MSGAMASPEATQRGCDGEDQRAQCACQPSRSTSQGRPQLLLVKTELQSWLGNKYCDEAELRTACGRLKYGMIDGRIGHCGPCALCSLFHPALSLVRGKQTMRFIEEDAFKTSATVLGGRWCQPKASLYKGGERMRLQKELCASWQLSVGCLATTGAAFPYLVYWIVAASGSFFEQPLGCSKWLLQCLK
jgi:hypothetical protein